MVMWSMPEKAFACEKHVILLQSLPSDFVYSVFCSIYPIKFSSKQVEIHLIQRSINTGPRQHPNWTLMTSVRFSSVKRKLRKLSCWERSKRWMWMAKATSHAVNWKRPLPPWVASNILYWTGLKRRTYCFRLMFTFFLWKKICWIFQRGEKMTAEEVDAIFSLLHINKDGKMNYAEVGSYYYHVISIATDPVAFALCNIQQLSDYLFPACDKCILLVSSLSISYLNIWSDWPVQK